MQNADTEHIHSKPTFDYVNILRVLCNFLLRYIPEKDPLFIKYCNVSNEIIIC